LYICIHKMDSLNSLLGPGYQVLVQGGDPVIVRKEPFESLGASTEYEFVSDKPTLIIPPEETREENAPREKTFDDRVFQFYVGSLSVVGLFILFRFMQKSR